jgi:mannose-1-phosphate guanylyltransferase/phosphomannomutase
MRAVIMAGGEGTRLRPLTSTLPKPMLPLGNRPLLEHVIALLRRHGFVDQVITVGARAEAIRAHFGDGAELGVRLSYAAEDVPLGTAGSVRHAMEGAREPFVVLSGDVLTDVDLDALVAFHHAQRAEVTVAVQLRDDPQDFGVVVTGADSQVERFIEKPARGRVFSDTVNTGIYVIDPSAFDAVPPDRAVDFAGEVFPRLLEQGRRVCACVVDGYWEDVGTLHAYLRAHEDLLDGRVRSTIDGFEIAAGIWLGEGAELHPAARVAAPAVIGALSHVEAGAEIGPYGVLGADVRVSAEACVERSVVHDHAYLGPGTHLRGSVVGRAARVRRGARLEEESVVADDAVIGEDAVIQSGVAVYPAKTVDPGASVDTSIIWETHRSRTVLGTTGVTGLANVDITPELAVRLAMAFATTIRRGGQVMVSRDTSRVGRVLKRAVTAGLNAAGVDVVDLDVTTLPVTRFAVRALGGDGGVSVRLVRGDAQAVSLRLLDERGIDLSATARKPLERILARQDVRRSLAGEIGDIVVAERLAESYTAALTAPPPAGLVDLQQVRARRMKVVLDYAYGAASFVMPNVLAKLGADVLSLNPYASTRQALGFDRAEHAAEVARLVVASGAELGAVIDSDGERLTIVDDAGRCLDDAEALVALLQLHLPVAGVGSPVVLPVSAPRAAESVIAAHGGRLLWTGLSEADVLDAATESRAVLAAGAQGGYAFPGFLPAFDAVAALVVLVALLAARPEHLSDLRSTTPVGAVAHEAVPTPFERTGAVMRALLDSCRGRDVQLVEGIKARFGDGWVLVAPDPDQPVTHVWAEADDAAAVAARVSEYAGIVRRVAGSRPVAGRVGR